MTDILESFILIVYLPYLAARIESFIELTRAPFGAFSSYGSSPVSQRDGSSIMNETLVFGQEHR